ncbi:MAG TPA: hypothetical protein VKY32_05570 [Flavobacterium sp.]|nr:hypothetical protein [Flavobacterium sp.]
MSLQEITLNILAERTLTQFDSKKLVDWAVKVLELGYENENLFVLAGLDFDSTEEREKYFWESLKDLKIEVEKDEEKLIENYALTIAKKVTKKEIEVDFAFKQMLKIVSASDYDQRYIAFYEIDEDLDYLRYDNSVIFNTGLNLENSKEFILEEFKIFIEMETLNIPFEDRRKCYCEKCNNLNIPVTKNKYQLKKPFKYLVWSCGICGSEKLKYNNNHEVKRMIIENFKKNYA